MVSSFNDKEIRSLYVRFLRLKADDIQHQIDRRKELESDSDSEASDSSDTKKKKRKKRKSKDASKTEGPPLPTIDDDRLSYEAFVRAAAPGRVSTFAAHAPRPPHSRVCKLLSWRSRSWFTTRSSTRSSVSLT